MSYPGVEESVLSAEDQAAIAKATAQLNDDAKYGLTGWGKKAMRQEFELECPSGQKCLVRKIPFEEILGLGILDNLDMFRAMLLAQSGSEEAGAAGEIKMLESFRDTEKRARFMGTVNKVVSAGVIKPKVVLIDDGDLPEGTVFAGDIEFQDKMFLFGLLFRGRVANLAQFRETEASDMGHVAEGQSIQEATD